VGEREPKSTIRTENYQGWPKEGKRITSMQIVMLVALGGSGGKKVQRKRGGVVPGCSGGDVLREDWGGGGERSEGKIVRTRREVSKPPCGITVRRETLRKKSCARALKGLEKRSNRQQ